jgi:hypothetical protein
LNARRTRGGIGIRFGHGWPAMRWIAAGVLIVMWLAGFPDLAGAQDNCQAMPAGPSRTDCYITLSRLHGAQSDLAAGKARVQSDAARYRAVTGVPPKPRPRRGY